MNGFIFLFGILGVGGLALWFAHSFNQWGKDKERLDNAERDLKAENERKKIDDTISKSDPSDNRVRLNKWAKPVPRFSDHPSDSS